jgi:glycosyltransferase involved in cell wall biosynthesis
MAKVLLSAFSCCPGMGSEAGIGWNFALGLSRRHDVTLLTTTDFKKQIDAYLREHPDVKLRVVYRNFPLPRDVMYKSYATANIYYYGWQILTALVSRALHKREKFDIVHHVNWGRYWMASGVAFSGARFVWGPIGAAEGSTSPMLSGMSLRGRWSERVRDFMRWIFEHDPLTTRTARNASAVIAATRETEAKLRSRWRVQNIHIIPAVGIAAEDLPGEAYANHDDEKSCHYQCVSIGRLLDWKGFHLGLRAFAQSGLARAGGRYAILGEGPEETRLRALAKELGIESSVDFLGQLPRTRCLQILSTSRMLVHPSLHDSGGFVLVEAMACGRPVVCLDVGGPAVLVDDSSGVKIRAGDADDAVRQLASWMRKLRDPSREPDANDVDHELYRRLSRGARERATREFLWTRKMEQIDAIYARVLGEHTSQDRIAEPSFNGASFSDRSATKKSEKFVA